MRQIFYVILLQLFTITCFSQDVLNKPSRLLTDNAHLLSPKEHSLLEKRLRKFADSTTIQLSIVTIPTFDGESLSEYANVLLNTWQLGDKGKHNGMLILVAGKTHDAAIAVGDDLARFTSEESRQAIIKYDIDTAFHLGKFYKGLDAAVNSLFYTAEAYDKVSGFENQLATNSSDSMIKHLPAEVQRQLFLEEYNKDPNNDWTNSPYFFGALIIIVLLLATIFKWRFPASWYVEEDD